MGCGGSKDPSASSPLNDPARKNNAVYQHLKKALAHVKGLNEKLEKDENLKKWMETLFPVDGDDPVDFPKLLKELEKPLAKLDSQPYMRVKKLDKKCEETTQKIKKTLDKLGGDAWPKHLGTEIDYTKAETEDCCKKLGEDFGKVEDEPPDVRESTEAAFVEKVRDEILSIEMAALCQLMDACQKEFKLPLFRGKHVDTELKTAADSLRAAATALEGAAAEAKQEAEAAAAEAEEEKKDDAAPAEAEEDPTAVKITKFNDLAEHIEKMLEKKHKKVEKDDLKKGVEMIHELHEKNDKDALYVPSEFMNTEGTEKLDIGPEIYEDTVPSAENITDAKEWDTDENIIKSSILLHKLLVNLRYTWEDVEKDGSSDSESDSDTEQKETLGGGQKKDGDYDTVVDALSNWLQEADHPAGKMSQIAAKIKNAEEFKLVQFLENKELEKAEKAINELIKGEICAEWELKPETKEEWKPGDGILFEGKGATKEEGEKWLADMKKLLQLVQSKKQPAASSSAAGPGPWFNGPTAAAAKPASWFKGADSQAGSTAAAAKPASWFRGQEEEQVMAQVRVDADYVQSSRGIQITRDEPEEVVESKASLGWFKHSAQEMNKNLNSSAPPELKGIAQNMSILADENLPEVQRVEAVQQLQKGLEVFSEKNRLGDPNDPWFRGETNAVRKPVSEVKPAFSDSDMAASVQNARHEIKRIQSLGVGWFRQNAAQSPPSSPPWFTGFPDNDPSDSPARSNNRPGSIETNIGQDSNFLKTRNSWNNKSKQDFDQACNVKFEKMAGGKTELDRDSFKKAFGLGSGMPTNPAANLLTESLFDAMDKTNSNSITLSEYQAVMDMYMNGDRDSKANFVWDVYQQNNRVDQNRLKQVTMGCIELVEDSCLSPGLRTLKSAGQDPTAALDKSLHKIFGGSDEISKENFVKLCRGSTIDLADVHIHTNPTMGSPMPAASPAPAADQAQWFRNDVQQQQPAVQDPYFRHAPAFDSTSAPVVQQQPAPVVQQQPVPVPVQQSAPAAQDQPRWMQDVQQQSASVPSMGPASVNNGQQQEQPRFGQQSGKFSLDAMLQDKFNQLDLDGNGVLEVPELRSVAQWFWSQSHAGEKPTPQQAERQLNKLSMRAQRLGGKIDFAHFSQFLKSAAEIGRCNDQGFRDSIVRELKGSTAALSSLVQLVTGNPQQTEVKNALHTLGRSLYSLTTGIENPSCETRSSSAVRDAESAVEQINWLIGTQKYSSDHLEDVAFNESYTHILNEMQGLDWQHLATNNLDQLYEPLYKLTIISLNICEECTGSSNVAPVQDWMKQPQVQQVQQVPQQNQNKLTALFNNPKPSPSPQQAPQQEEVQQFVMSPSPTPQHNGESSQVMGFDQNQTPPPAHNQSNVQSMVQGFSPDDDDLEEEWA